MNGTGEFWPQIVEEIVCPLEFEPRYADTESESPSPFPRSHLSHLNTFDSFNSFNIARLRHFRLLQNLVPKIQRLKGFLGLARVLPLFRM